MSAALNSAGFSCCVQWPDYRGHVIIPGAGHGAAGSAYGKRRQKDYFVRNLLGVEPRWEP